MLTEKRVEKLMQTAQSYAADQCYQAADRQIYLLYEEIIAEIAAVKRWDAKTSAHYQRLCQMVLGE